MVERPRPSGRAGRPRGDGVAVLARVGDFVASLDEDTDQSAIDALRLAKSTARPVGEKDWIARLEADTNRTLAPEKRGPKPLARAKRGQGGLSNKLST